MFIPDFSSSISSFQYSFVDNCLSFCFCLLLLVFLFSVLRSTASDYLIGIFKISYKYYIIGPTSLLNIIVSFIQIRLIDLFGSIKMYVKKKMTILIDDPVPSIRWLIELCLTWTWAIFQLYRDDHKIYWKIDLKT